MFMMNEVSKWCARNCTHLWLREAPWAPARTGIRGERGEAGVHVRIMAIEWPLWLAGPINHRYDRWARAGRNKCNTDAPPKAAILLKEPKWSCADRCSSAPAVWVGQAPAELAQPLR